MGFYCLSIGNIHGKNIQFMNSEPRTPVHTWPQDAQNYEQKK